MNALGQRVCLNMIVKDEAGVIGRCLASVLALIDCWVVVDTGSTDGTQGVIRELLAGVPGELHERPWVNFAHNRSEALELARGMADYVFTIDADEVVHLLPGFALPELTHDCYAVAVHYGGLRYMRRQFVKDGLPWRYEGVLHEHLVCEEAKSEEYLPGIMTIPHHDGARARDPLTYKKDAAILERMVAADPLDARSQFYLAQSYRDAGELEAALAGYGRRAQMGGWLEEVWFSLYQCAVMRERLQEPWDVVLEAYLAAVREHPGRAEPLYRIALHYQATGAHREAFEYLERAVKVTPPGADGLFVEHALYAYQMAIDHAVEAFYVGDHEAAIAGNNLLLRQGRLPQSVIDQVVRNRRYSLDYYAGVHRGTWMIAPAVTVFVPIDLEPGVELDDCLHSLLQQQGEPFEVVILASPGSEVEEARVLLAPYFSLMYTDDAPWVAMRNRAGSVGVAMLLRPGLRLEHAGVLAGVRAVFADSACGVAYGQIRLGDGRLGTAEPVASAAMLEALREDPARMGPLVVRGSVLGAAEGSTCIDVLRAAGFAGLRFTDEVWSAGTVVGGVLAECLDEPAGELPKISCMMVTLDRLTLARRAILDFARQSYGNRELVIVTDGSAAFKLALERYVSYLGLGSVVFVFPEGARRNLGQLRNLALEAAAGEIVCQWDDDDNNHPERLLEQARYLAEQGADACFFTDHLQLIEERRSLCWVDWTATPGVSEAVPAAAIGPKEMVPGTLMMRRNERIRYPEEGSLASQGEDSVVLYELCRTGKVVALSGMGYLYLYRFHGRNTFSREHHYNLMRFGFASERLNGAVDKLREAGRYFAVPRPCYVVASDGPVYALD